MYFGFRDLGELCVEILGMRLYRIMPFLAAFARSV